MSEESFYLTLLSNSSMTYFSENTTTNFSTKLPKTIKLDGVWVVGVVEFQYPCSMYTVQESQNVVHIAKTTKIVGIENESPSSVLYKTRIPATNYENTNQILSALNKNPMLMDTINFRYDDVSKLVLRKILNNNVTRITLSPTLALQLGFAPKTNFVTTAFGKYPVNLHLGLPSQLFVYSDIISPQIVGDVMSSLLRIIPLDPTKYIYGSYKMHIFSPAHYIPVMRREFDTIEIDIRTNTGEKIPFQFGISCVKLHFKRLQ